MYETPILEGPVELYETPLVVDIDLSAGVELGDLGCVTGGSSGGPLDDNP